jgi:hypothetical protein
METATYMGLQKTDGAGVMAYEAMNTAPRPEIRDQDKPAPRSTLRDHALLMLFILVVAVSMGGWLWFLGSLSWRLVVWAMY